MCCKKTDKTREPTLAMEFHLRLKEQPPFSTGIFHSTQLATHHTVLVTAKRTVRNQRRGNFQPTQKAIGMKKLTTTRQKKDVCCKRFYASSLYRKRAENGSRKVWTLSQALTANPHLKEHATHATKKKRLKHRNLLFICC